MFCGSCMHDNTLSAALIELGCNVQLIPLYTPIRTDEKNVSIDRVFFGGINVFLQQKLPLFRYLPSFLDGWLNHPHLIDRIASWSMATNPQQLGPMTVSMLRGESGHQKKELVRLVSWLSRNVQPNIVNLTNILIAGCVPVIKKHLRVPVLVTLQGDDLFLESLPEPYKTQAMVEIRRLAVDIDAFIVFSRYYADFMSDYLQIPRERLHIVPLGIKLEDFITCIDKRSEDRQPTVGYFARISPEKGFHVLVDAFLLLRKMKGTENVHLRVAGWLGQRDGPFFQQQLQKLEREEGAEAFEYVGVLDRKEKIEFFRSIDVLSVPTTYREPKGIFVLEALASGVPVVEPEHGSFPELVAATGGGCLVQSEDAEDLARTLHRLLTDSPTRMQLGRLGRQKVLQMFTAEAMAKRTLAVYEQYLSKKGTVATVRKMSHLFR